MKKLRFKDKIYELSKDEAFTKIERLITELIKSYLRLYSYDDLFQMGSLAFIKAYESYDVNKEIQFVTYFSRVLSNELNMYHRKNKKHFSTSSLNEIIPDSDNVEFINVITDNKNYEDLAISNIISANIEPMLKVLSPRKQKIIRLKFIEEKTQFEIAQILGLSQSYISRQLSTALHQLREEINY